MSHICQGQMFTDEWYMHAQDDMADCCGRWCLESINFTVQVGIIRLLKG